MGKAKPASSANSTNTQQQQLHALPSVNPFASLQSLSALSEPVELPSFTRYTSSPTTTSSNTHPSIQIILKKLGKKDATTKIKAFEELLALLQAEPELVVQIIPIWHRVFNRFGIDIERRIRILTFTIHSHIVDTAKSKLGTHLRDLITIWMIGQYDRDVETIARDSFQASFQVSKRIKVLEHCRQTLLDSIDDFLIVKTPESLGDPRFESVEGMKLRYERVMVCSLKLLVHLSENLSPHVSINEQALSKHFTSPYSGIRRQMAHVTRAHVKCNSLLPIWWAQLVRRCWEESDPRVAADVWAAVAEIISNNNDMLQLTQNETSSPKKLYHYIESKAHVHFISLPSIKVYIKSMPHVSNSQCWESLCKSVQKLGARPSKACKQALLIFATDLIMVNGDLDPTCALSELVFGYVKSNRWSLLFDGMNSESIDAFNTVSLPSPNVKSLISDLKTHCVQCNPNRLALCCQNVSIFSLARHLARHEIYDHASSLLESVDTIQWSIDFLLAMKSTSSISLETIRLAAKHSEQCFVSAVSLHDGTDAHSLVSCVLACVEQFQYSLDTVLPKLPPGPWQEITDYCIVQLKSPIPQFIVDAMHGYANGDEIVLASFNMDDQLVSSTLVSTMKNITNPVVAKWAVLNLDDQEWSETNLKCDLSAYLIEALLDNHFSVDQWHILYFRLNLPMTVFANKTVMSVLSNAPIQTVHNGFLDLPQSLITECEMECTIMSGKLSCMVEHIPDMDLFDIAWLEFAGLCKAVLNLDFAVLEHIDKNAALDFFWHLSTQSNLCAAQVSAFQVVAAKVLMRIEDVFDLISQACGLNELRLLAAMLCNLPKESAILEHHASRYADILVREPLKMEYVMLLNATRCHAPVLDDELVADIVQSIYSEDQSMPTMIHCAMLLQHHPCAQQIQFAWLYIDETDVSGSWGNAFWDAVIPLIKPGADVADEVLAVQRVAERWFEAFSPSITLARFCADVSCNYFDEVDLYTKMCSPYVHEQVAAAHILSRKIGLKVQELSLQFTITKYEGVSDELKLHPQLMSVIQSTAPEFGLSLSWLLHWLALYLHFDTATLGLKLFWLENLEFNNLIEYVVEVLVEYGEKSLSPWDISCYEPLSLLDMESNTDDHHLSHMILCAHLYYQALIHTPVQVREWFNSCRDKYMSRIIEQITAIQYSPMILALELSSLDKELTDLKVNVLRSNSGAQVSAVYTIDEASLELRVNLPSQYPLRPVEVSGGDHSLIVGTSTWRAWVLGCGNILRSQNASIADALQLFLKNVQLHVGGISEPCAICYSIVGVSCKTLPTKTCRTCKHAYHGICLFRWFKKSTSGATCPLCRSLF